MSYFNELLVKYFAPAAAGGLTDLGGIFGAGFATVTDGRLWRSLAWLVLGVLLVVVGLVLIVLDQTGGVGGLVGSAVKAAL